jgi:hypothetical protein
VAHVFVYYRVAAPDAAAARREVAALQAFLRPHCGLAPRLLRRCDDPATWMEVYEDLADAPALIDAMGAWLGATELDVLGRCERHLECFSDA